MPRAPRRMGSADVLWLTMDRPNNLMVVVSVVLLGSVPDWDRVRRLLLTRLVDPYPVFSQRPKRSGRVLGRYRWEDDPDFDLERHVRRATLSGRGTPAQADTELQAYIEEQLSRPFDRARPLWEAHLVDGHGSGAALVFRSHHALADGIALTRVLLGLTEDDGGVPGDLEGPAADTDLSTLPLGVPATTGPVSSALRLARVTTRAAWARLRDKGSRAVVRDAASLALRTGQVVSDLLLTTSPPSAVGGVPGRAKRVVWTQPVPLAGLKGVGRLVGATLNDVLVGAVAGALHDYQHEHGQPPADLVTMVPVNVRPLDEPLPAELGNRFALVFLRLPSGDATPLGRLALAKSRMDWLKASPEAALTFALISVIGRFPATIQRRVVDFFADKAIGVTTNVAGPRRVRHLAGVPVTGVLGWVPGSGRHTLGFCIVTYDDAVRIGIMGDESVVPDPEALLAALEDGLSTLDRIGTDSRTAPRRRRPRS